MFRKLLTKHYTTPEHQPAGSLVEEAIAFRWGERCPDFDSNCAGCIAWAEYDDLLRSPYQPAHSPANLDKFDDIPF